MQISRSLMNGQIIQLVRDKVEKDFKELWTEQLSYHNYEHTLNVTKFAQKLAEEEQISKEDQEILEIAALLHDIGYLTGYFDHEDRSSQVAETLLVEQNYPVEKIEQVKRLIKATKPDHEPETRLEEIIRDADLYNLASPEYAAYAQKLRDEWEYFLNNDDSDTKWIKENHKFLKNHDYYTASAKRIFSEQKDKNIKQLKTEKRELKVKNGNLELNKNRSAQMMFKTALRNHIDLTHIADNKANIMLTINSIIISITMPLIATYIKNNPDLLYPTILLLLTSITSIVFATLVTRPVKTRGTTNLDNIRTGSTNLFFFGNFYKMNLKSYRDGMKEVIADTEILDSSIVNDLYYLGKALGHKFSKLRYCYLIFMVGMVLTVLSFFITYVIL